jgi:2-amino-4-hydroxy-6-hydroxymethyldihydropteridine diphosphokinase
VRKSIVSQTITLDIDILLFDELCGVFHGIHLPRPEIKDNAYVLWPLAEIAGFMKLPGDTQTLSAMWAGYRKETQKLWPVAFNWAGVGLPHIIDL